MMYSTEVFVMIINLIGVPLFAGVIRPAKLPGAGYFLLAYSCLMLSNIFTVLEGFWLEYIFNLFEHASITISSFFFFIAMKKFISGRESEKPSLEQRSTQ